MIKVEIPGDGFVELEHFVTDFSGTLSEDGFILPGVREKIEELSNQLRIHVLTSDTFGRARTEMEGVTCAIHVLEGEAHMLQKEQYVKNLGADKVVAVGNGNNDKLMLRAAKLGIAVCLREGCSKEAVEAAQILVTSPIDAINLLLFPKRLMATLRV